MDRARYDRYFETMDTFGIPGTKVYVDHPLWKKDPKTGRRKNLGTFSSRARAEKHERAVQFFKRS